jgi:hypothetical protein
MLLLIGIVLFCFGAALFSLAVAVWLFGLVLRVALRLFEFTLLLIIAGIKLYLWQRRRRPEALDGEILPPLTDITECHAAGLPASHLLACDGDNAHLK